MLAPLQVARDPRSAGLGPDHAAEIARGRRRRGGGVMPGRLGGSVRAMVGDLLEAVRDEHNKGRPPLP
jgi:hypothetical protein